ncbi:MAG: hypothetical protein O3A53_21130, partial [Acidobacteria bacterium]|nr:hypothetical protein [Acidobacteriota bacterium]
FVHLTSMIKEVARAEEVTIIFNTEGLSIKENDAGTRPPFSTDWIRDRILAPGALNGLNSEARGIMLGMVNCKSRSNNPSLKRPIGSASPERNCGS